MKPELIMTLHVEVGEPLPVGRVPGGELAIIPITGGTFEGPKLRGRVLPGGADWNTRLSPQESHALARYWIQTDDGAVICVRNEGFLRQADDPDSLRTTPSFRCDLDGPYAFLTQGKYEGTLRGAGEHAVEIGVFECK
ncbi:MAG: DUF3237 domain-containing protein [Firmicutes bacterium]|nr:DUF3237 domain-containing protein [Bacillota bacterium]